MIEQGVTIPIKKLQNMKNLENKAEDIINQPSHYHKGGIDVYEIMQAKYSPEIYRGFCIGNVEKYVKRHELKGNPVEDLKKARFNLDRLIESYEGITYIPGYKRENAETEIEKLRNEIRELKKDKRRVYVQKVLEENLELSKEVETQKKRIASLEERLERNDRTAL